MLGATGGNHPGLYVLHHGGWTLDAVASRLGVSRRLLVRIEGGEANPSLSSLLSIAAGFEIPLADLLAEEETQSVSVQTDNASAPVLWASVAGSEARLLVASGGMELWDWRLEPGEERLARARRPGAREALTVTSGLLTVEMGDTRTEVAENQSAASAADAGFPRPADRRRRRHPERVDRL